MLPGSQLSNVPWRRQGVKYANNEAYFDCIEDVDAIIDASGTVVSAEIHGNVGFTVLKFITNQFIWGWVTLFKLVPSEMKYFLEKEM